jgi:hypothetical protein
MWRPNLYIFNPTSDFATANGTPSWQPGLILKTMENEMANLPQYLCAAEDIVLVPKVPDKEFLSRLDNAGFQIPLFRETGSFLKSPAECNHLYPWGWSPAMHHQLKNLKPYCSTEFLASPVSCWREDHKELFSRITAKNILELLISEYAHESFIEPEALPVVCSSMDTIAKLANKWNRLMIKSPWSSSGRGVIPITGIPIHDSIKNRIRGMLKDQGYLMAEPYLQKQADLAFLYEITESEVKFKGYSHFQTDHKGRYTGNFLQTHQPELSPEVTDFMDKAMVFLPEIHTGILKFLNINRLYRGHLGIDTLIYSDPEGKFKINPCLEINWRFTMGHVALHIEKHLHPGSKGYFGIWQGNKIPFSEFVRNTMKDNSLITCNGRISEGFLPLTEFSGNCRFGAYLEVW